MFYQKADAFDCVTYCFFLDTGRFVACVIHLFKGNTRNPFCLLYLLQTNNYGSFYADFRMVNALDLQRMSRIAANVLLGLFVFLLVFILLAWHYMGMKTTRGMGDFYLYALATVVLIFAFLYFTRGTWRGAIVTNPGAKPWPTLTRPYGWRTVVAGNLEPVYKFGIFFVGMILLGVIISPGTSLERAILYVAAVMIGFGLFLRWAYIYDPDPYTDEEVQETLTPAERADPLTRTIDVSLPFNRTFDSCMEIIDEIFVLPLPESNRSKGTINLMFKNSRLIFDLTPGPVSGSTHVFISLTPDLPAKWYPQKDRRENIRYLERISSLLTEKAAQE